MDPRARPCHTLAMPTELPTSAAGFDRGLVRARRERAAAGFAAHDFLLREIGERLADRLADFTRAFPVALAFYQCAGPHQSIKYGSVAA